MRKEKQYLLDEIKKKIDGAEGFIVASYKGMTAAQSRQFRNQLAEVGGEFEVVPKRIFIKAADASGIQFDASTFEGHVGVVFTQEDATKIAKSTVKYGKDNDDAVSVIAGQIDGEVCTKEEVTAIATLPSIDELRAQIVGLFAAPMAQTVGAMNQALSGVLNCMDEKSKKE